MSDKQRPNIDRTLTSILDRALEERLKLMTTLEGRPSAHRAEVNRDLGAAELRILLAALVLGKAPAMKAIVEEVENLGSLTYLAGMGRE